MIVMSNLRSSQAIDGVVAEYEAASSFTGASGYVHDVSAYVRLRLTGVDGSDTRLLLDIEHVRYLAEVLPDLLMSHDAAERPAREQAAAAVAESKAA
ncbi:hypothetical protein [Nocardia asteroides]|uniref:hypothetical protein n=1 Tax=Nocardia asteroides TaxID=1824 RepID=UPI0033DFEFB2